MLGYGVIAPDYPFEFPRVLVSAGYTLAVSGKDHFGWNRTKGVRGAIAHGYGTQEVYDGINFEPDQYTTWFRNQTNGSWPESCFPTLDHNSWKGAANVCDEHLLPTGWTGRAAIRFINAHADAGTGGTPPFLLKVSFVRPHSPCNSAGTRTLVGQ